MAPRVDMDEAGDRALAGRRVLIVEDKYDLAEDLRRAPAGMRAEVLGPTAAQAPDARSTRSGTRSGSTWPSSTSTCGARDGLHGRRCAERVRHALVFATGYDAAVPPPLHHAGGPASPRALAG